MFQIFLKNIHRLSFHIPKRQTGPAWPTELKKNSWRLFLESGERYAQGRSSDSFRNRTPSRTSHPVASRPVPYFMELTAAGLFRIYTWFPFNCSPRKGVANQCGTKIGSLFVFSKLGGYSFSFVLIRKRKNQLVFFDIFCIFVNETVTYYKIYQISGF